MENKFDGIENELIISATRSGGKGGQNVNKVATRIEISFNIKNTISFSVEEKAIFFRKLAKKIDKNGNIRVVSQKERSQYMNKMQGIEKLKNILSNALKPEKKRLKTKPTGASKVKRLISKKVISEKKSFRKKDYLNDYDN